MCASPNDPIAGNHRPIDHVIADEEFVAGVEIWPDGVDPGTPPQTPGRRCQWCSTAIVPTGRPGRPRLYCRRSCRQRAYERRSGIGVLPPVERRLSSVSNVVASSDPRPHQYEAGMGRAGTVRHAMRPAGRPDRAGRWPTLCGVEGRPVGRPFATVDPRACLSCAEIQRSRPPGEPFAPSARLAALRAVVDDAAAWVDRRDRWMRGSGPADGEPTPVGTFGAVVSTADLVRLLIAAAA